MRLLPLACLVLLLAACSDNVRDAAPVAASDAGIRAIEVPEVEHPDGETAAWWYRSGAARAAANGAMQGRAKNVILFVGDGMSLTTVAAARILDGQREGGPGEANLLAWEHFPATALAKTYNTDSQIPDSAGTMTAMVAGVKTRAGVINVGPQPQRGDCTAALRAPLLSLWELAADAGMATGVVSTARLTHATPAATFARAADRGWENDAELPAEASAAGCIDIARQLIEPSTGPGPEVLLGGGRRNFMTVEQRDPEYDDKSGLRRDGRDLIAAWRQRHPRGAYVWNAEQLASAPADAPLLGLFEPSHMQFEHDRADDAAGEPSLAELTRAAIARLQRNDSGYVLLIEAGRIDHAHHAGNAIRALVDTIAMSEAVQAAVDATSVDDTLILVTADHAHALTFTGYPRRGSPILGKVQYQGESGEPVLAQDGLGLPYTTLGYANGPGYRGFDTGNPPQPITFYSAEDGFEPRQGRPDLTEVDTGHEYFQQEATVPRSSATHGGDDVGIWASGPGSTAVRGTLEQNVIYHLIVQATPTLRQRLCAEDLCNADGVPVELPPVEAFLAP